MNQKAESKRSTVGGMYYLCIDAVSDGIHLTQAREFVRLIAEQIIALGNQSLGLIAASSISMGAIMAIQFGNALQRFGGTLYVPELVGLSLFRELGPMLTSLLLAGKIGSGMTAEIASMKVTEQVDAIRALGDSPMATLALPRILASLIAFPVLTLFGDMLSLLSAMLVSYSEQGIGLSFYWSKTLQTITWADLWTGVTKTIVFALYISVAACWKGLETTGGTRSVGISTTWIVVRSSIFILIADFFLTKFFILTVFRHG